MKADSAHEKLIRAGVLREAEGSLCMAMPFLNRTSLAEYARQVRLDRYKPDINLSGLLPGVDNIRHDVTLSPRFYEVMQAHIGWLLEHHGNVEDLARETSADRRPTYERAMGKKTPIPRRRRKLPRSSNLP